MTELPPFEYDYRGSDIVYGRGCIDRLDELLGDRTLEDALVVCGSNVGANEAVMEPVRRGLSDRLAGVFAETTPEKTADTAYDGIEAMETIEADVLVGVGGGSSLDIARQMSVLSADGRPRSEFESAAEEGVALEPDPGEPLTPVVVVPTTFAGADVSTGGSVLFRSGDESPTGQPVQVSGPVMPTAMLYDPDLFETTPADALAGSAMNGFDKGIETIYSGKPTPITDSTAIRGLEFLAESFPRLGEDSGAMERAVVGSILVQFEREPSIVHAFGHGFSRRYPVQQGYVHAVMVPHVLRYVFEEVDGRRRVLAEGLGVDSGATSNGQLAEQIIDEVVDIRDSLGTPTRLRELGPVDRNDFPSIARFIRDDDGLGRTPEGLDPTVDDIEAILRRAW